MGIRWNSCIAVLFFICRLALASNTTESDLLVHWSNEWDVTNAKKVDSTEIPLPSDDNQLGVITRGPPQEAIITYNLRLGINITAHDYPFIVSLREKGRGGQHFCAGSLLSTVHILTAAHCVASPSANKRFTVKDARTFEVGVGLHDRNSSDRRHWFAVKSVHVHEQYVKVNDTIRHDIALLTLEKPVQPPLFGGKANSFKLPPNRNTNPRAGEYLIAIGWGKTTIFHDELPRLLLGARLQVITDAECAKRLKKGKTMPPEIICVDNTQTTTCGGDNGGPLFQKIGQQKFRLVGITSYFPPKCIMRNMASVFTRVSQYLPWIKAARARNI
ncbi:putative Chymotrypsinogen B [Hypsibius exemplaris]|uniref:Chymotrypsinogen B n=1 Tax=Hypsibius exemplaris TaxID=2072580 RepID=A0A1W0WIL2_HYPEX|nr:putative Chymotrypsinogen B [Hypsibius exemplaris]